MLITGLLSFARSTFLLLELLVSVLLLRELGVTLKDADALDLVEGQILLELASRLVEDIHAFRAVVNDIKAKRELALLKQLQLLYCLAQPATNLPLLDAQGVALVLHRRTEGWGCWWLLLSSGQLLAASVVDQLARVFETLLAYLARLLTSLLNRGLL